MQPMEYFTQLEAQRIKFFERRIRDGAGIEDLKLANPEFCNIIDKAAKNVAEGNSGA